MMTKETIAAIATVFTAHAATIRRSMHQLQIDDPVVVQAFHARLDELNALRAALDGVPVGEPVSPMTMLPQLDRLASELGKDAFAREHEPGRWEIGIHDATGCERSVTLVRAGALWRVKIGAIDVAMELDAEVIFAIISRYA